LKNPDISPDKIRLRQRLVDVEGQVFKRGFATEVDLIAENDRLIVFEVKATAKPSEVDIFALKAELVAAQNPDRQVRGVLITLAPSEDVRQRCAECGLELRTEEMGFLDKRFGAARSGFYQNGISSLPAKRRSYL
ncbi:MAG: hypothetical protein ACE5HA_11240, partial [Anaerolineae bacterium]